MTPLCSAAGRRPAALLLVATLLLAACAPLPLLDNRPESRRQLALPDTTLGRAVLPLAQAHPRLSGVVPLLNGGDAFATRVLLADAAEQTLDVQYYIWQRDLSGTLLMDALRRAADRGVRVRLLLDDNNTAGLDAPLAALATHPNMQVRLFNPFTLRNWRLLGMLLDFSRLNRRMHNKSFTADNLATIVGGRNVGDAYFDAGDGPLFVDLDVLAIGSVVDDVSNDFDRYWASASSYPAERLLPPVDPAARAELARDADAVARDPAAVAYVQALQQSPFIRDLLAGRTAFDWAPVRLLSDDPAKGLGQAGDGQLLWPALKQALAQPTRALKIVSAYFVPGAEGTADLTAMAQRGVAVDVLTNSLEATDVAVVHAGYAKRRTPLLQGGVNLYEIKRAPAPTAPALATAPAPVQRRLGGSGASSSSSLHAKAVSVDDRQLFIGSFNFDPRSARLNTELGFVIDSPALAQSLAAAFERNLPGRVYRLGLTPQGTVQWAETGDGQSVVHDSEPGVSIWKRIGVFLLSLLPIEWLL